MKILFISQNFYPELGAAANRTYVMFKILNKTHHKLNVLTSSPSYPTKSLFENNIYFNDCHINNLENKQIYRLKIKRQKQGSNFFNRIMYFIEEFLKLRRFLAQPKRQFDYDCIYVSSPNIFMAWATLFFKKKGIKYILEIRDLWPDSANQISNINIKLIMPILKFLEKKMYNSADMIVVNNLSFRDHIVKSLKNIKPIFYLPNGIQKSEIQKCIKYNSFTAIYTGNIGYAQDVEKLIDMAYKLNENCIHFIAIVYGVNAPKFRAAVKNLEYIEIKSPMPRKNCLEEISKAHVSLSLLKPSPVFLNVLPGKIIDSISMGTIPITNLGGYTKQIITENNLGIAMENASVDTLFNEIKKIKIQSDKLKEMQYNSIKYRNNNFIWEDNIKKFEKFILEGVRNGRNLQNKMRKHYKNI